MTILNNKQLLHFYPPKSPQSCPCCFYWLMRPRSTQIKMVQNESNLYQQQMCVFHIPYHELAFPKIVLSWLMYHCSKGLKIVNAKDKCYSIDVGTFSVLNINQFCMLESFHYGSSHTDNKAALILMGCFDFRDIILSPITILNRVNSLSGSLGHFSSLRAQSYES